MTRKSLTLAAVLVLSCAALGACNKDRADGSAQKTTGKVEEAAGQLTGSEKLKNDGRKDQVVGGVKTVVGDVKDTVHDATKSDKGK